MTHLHKIFYGAAIQGAEKRSDRAHINSTIIESIKSFGFQVISEHTTGLDFDDTANKLEESIGPLPPVGRDRTVFIRNKMIEFVESDINAAVFEVSTPSLGTGIEIAHAYLRARMGLAAIPVIALYQNGFWPNKLSAMIKGITEEEVAHFHLIEYNTSDDISRLLKPVLCELDEAFPFDKETNKDSASGRVTARKCQYCGHHEIGIEKSNGKYVALRPGMNVQVNFDLK